MSDPAASSAVELIATAAGTLPVKLFARDEKGREADRDHPAFRLAHDEANDWTSTEELLTRPPTSRHLRIKGKAGWGTWILSAGLTSPL